MGRACVLRSLALFLAIRPCPGAVPSTKSKRSFTLGLASRSTRVCRTGHVSEGRVLQVWPLARCKPLMVARMCGGEYARPKKKHGTLCVKRGGGDGAAHGGSHAVSHAVI